jgi:methyltransferase
LVVAGFVAYVALLAVQRAFELALSARNARALRAKGGALASDPVYPGIVALHSVYPIALALEVFALGARPPAWWPLPLALVIAAQGLRYAAMRALGERWNVRVWVVPGEPRVSRGIYRWLTHPNYVAVAIEFAAAPLMFGAWRTALVASAVNAVLLFVRIRLEDRALDGAAAGRPAATSASPNP